MQPGKESKVWESLAGLKALLHLLADSATEPGRVGGGTWETLLKAGGGREEISLLLRQSQSPSAWIPLSERTSAPPNSPRMCRQAQVSCWCPSSCRKYCWPTLPVPLTLSGVVSTHSLGFFSSPGARQKSFPCVHLKEVCLSRGVGSLLTVVMGRPSCLKRKTNEYVPLTPSLIRHKPKGVPCSNIRSTLLDNTPPLPPLLTFFRLGQAFFCLYLLFLSCLLLARPAWGKWENSAGPTSQDFWVGTAQGQRCSKDLSWQSWRRGCHEQVGTQGQSVWGMSRLGHETEVGEKVPSLLTLGFPLFSAHLSR